MEEQQETQPPMVLIYFAWFGVLSAIEIAVKFIIWTARYIMANF